MKNEKNYMGFLKHKIWQILKHFSRALGWAQTSYLWGVDFYNEESNTVVSYTEKPYIEEYYIKELEKCAKQGSMMMPVYYDNVDKYLSHTIIHWTMWERSLVGSK